MRNYDVIAVGSGSAMNIIPPMLRRNPEWRAAVIDKDEPGGICLTRGCIPTKILVYPAELVRVIEHAKGLGIDAPIKKVDFADIMARMRRSIGGDIEAIRLGLSRSENLDYYHATAEFVSPYTLKVGDETITSKLILLCLGSKPSIPPVKGLAETGYLTSDTVLGLRMLPRSLAIVGGGYIAAEYGHFFSAMGSEVTVIGRNPQFLPQEEPEVSKLALREMSRHMTILTNHEVLKAEKTPRGRKTLKARDRVTEKTATVTADEVLVATGRRPNTDALHPELGGIETDEKGWIKVNEYLETSQPGIWAFGDATGKHMFKHVANYESILVYHNAVLGARRMADYRAVPHAVFAYPEVAAVGLREAEAVEAHGKENVLVGFQRYRDTAKGSAMGAGDFFVKVLVKKDTREILGAHIIGPEASVLIQEVINLMYTPDRSMAPISDGMHIHPSLSEVVERAFGKLMGVDMYHHVLEHHH
jgi:mycothione reductase